MAEGAAVYSLSFSETGLLQRGCFHLSAPGPELVGMSGSGAKFVSGSSDSRSYFPATDTLRGVQQIWDSTDLGKDPRSSLL